MAASSKSSKARGASSRAAGRVGVNFLGVGLEIPPATFKLILSVVGGIAVFAVVLMALFPSLPKSVGCLFGNCAVSVPTAVAAVAPTPRFPNATNYVAERGYTGNDRPSPNDACKAWVTIANVTVRDGEIRFTSDDRTWIGSIRQTDGHITINHDGISPRTRTPTSVEGYYTSAKMQNGYCGEGFFRLRLPGS